MAAKRADGIVGSDNYFHWEFAMRMTLAKKGLLAHAQIVKLEAEITDAWMLNDMKALGIIARIVSLERQTKIDWPLSDPGMGYGARLPPDYAPQPHNADKTARMTIILKH